MVLPPSDVVVHLLDFADCAAMNRQKQLQVAHSTSFFIPNTIAHLTLRMRSPTNFPRRLYVSWTADRLNAIDRQCRSNKISRLFSRNQSWRTCKLQRQHTKMGHF